MEAQLPPIHCTRCSIRLSKLKPKAVSSYSTLRVSAGRVAG
jgi:hypothetical protein